MESCKICKKEYKGMKGLGIHIVGIHKITTKEYYDKYIGSPNICGCGKEANFINLVNGYTTYCSMSCTNKSSSHKANVKDGVQKKYGCDCVFQNKDIKEKIKQYYRDGYGVEHNSQTKNYKDKFKETMLERHGVEHALQNKKLKSKQETTMLERHGVVAAIQNDELREKIENTNLLRLGVANPFESDEIKAKSKQTIQNKYGVDNISQSEEIKDKKKETFLKRYNVENPFQYEEFQEKSKETLMNKYGVDNISRDPEIQKQKAINIKRTFYKKLLSDTRLKQLVLPEFIFDDYNGVEEELYDFSCCKCKTQFKDHLANGRIPRCPQCFPLNKSFSEINIYEFVQSIYSGEVISGDRTILEGKEIDIYIPDLKLGIEFNGLYWHSELGGNTDKYYHLNKTEACLNKDIQLLHIFEDEWIEKQEIVKSMIKNRLGLSEKIYARKCLIEEIDSKDAKQFLDENHIQGSISGKHFGLIYNNELASLLTMGKPRYNKNYEWEILRFCNKINNAVVGGYSKLFKYFIGKCDPKSIITYSDRRYGEGKVYETFGFGHISKSNPGYYYMVDYIHRESRLKYQKHLLESKLKIFDPGLSEWQNMQLGGYDRIWDCGNNVYELRV